MRVIRLVLLMLVLGVTAGSGALSAQDKVRVHVAAVGETEGFAAAGASDSVRDLVNAINKKKRLTAMTTRDEADVIVLVENRESHWENGRVTSWTDSKGESHVYQPISNTRVVHAVLQVGEYKTPLHGESATWTGASDRVAGDVDKWVDANIVRLMARRADRKP